MSANDLLNIYSRLYDDESKSIFKSRLSFFLDRDEQHLERIVNESLENGKILKKGINTFIDFMNLYTSEKRVVLYGAGAGAPEYLTYLNDKNIPVNCFCDSNPKKWDTLHVGLPVVSPDSLNRETDLICISTAERFNTEIYEFLIKRGFLGNQIFISGFETQYFCPSFFAAPVNADEVYIDAGCLNGNTINDFIKFCNGKYKKIYGFEPDGASFKETQNFVSDENIDNIELYDKGVWSNNCKLSFNNNLRGSSNISEDGNVSIECVSIDSVVKDAPVTFIKMDVEGSELEALKGAANTIKKNRPKLAICIYHKPEDIIDIPLFIYGLVPEYHFFIRHHEINSTETVLYARV